jgi:hypothetical protein
VFPSPEVRPLHQPASTLEYSLRRSDTALRPQPYRAPALRTPCFSPPIRLENAVQPAGLSEGADADPTPERRYSTRWCGAVTLDELLSDPQVRKIAFAKARSLGYIGADAEDCFQLGCLNLWQVLQQDPNLLHDKGPAWVGIWITFSGSRRALWKHAKRCVSLDDPVSDRERLDASPLFQPRGRPERWAGWATRVDQRIDFAILMTTLANRYADEPLKLLALYALTTSVKMKDVASVAGIDKKRFTQVAGNAVKADLWALLKDEGDATAQFWKRQVYTVEQLACITRVAEQVMDNQRLLLALYIVTTSATRKAVTDLFGIPLTAFRKEMITIKLLLAEEHRTARRQ